MAPLLTFTNFDAYRESLGIEPSIIYLRRGWDSNPFLIFPWCVRVQYYSFAWGYPLDWGGIPLLQQHHLPRQDEIACLEAVKVDARCDL